MMSKLRELAQDHQSQEESLENQSIEQEYLGLQDELHRIAHTMEHKNQNDEENSKLEIGIDYDLEQLSLEAQESSKIVKLDLLSPSAPIKTLEVRELKPNPDTSAIVRLDNALIDLDSYRQLMGNQGGDYAESSQK